MMDGRSQDAKAVVASHPVCRHVFSRSEEWGSHSAPFPIPSWIFKNGQLKQSNSSHKTPQRAIFHDCISQHNHALLIAKQKWNIWEFALSVQNSSPDKIAVAAFDMLTSGWFTVVSDSPSPAQAKWELVAVAEISFELEQWKLLCS